MVSNQFGLVHKEEQAHDNSVWSLAVGKGEKDTDCIITGSLDDTVKAWQWSDSGLSLRYIFEGHALGVVSVDINKEGNLTASSSLDSHIRLWDLGSGEQAQNIDAGPVDAWQICFSPDAKLIATASNRMNNSKINLYSSETGKLDHHIDTGGKFTLALDWSPDGQHIVTGAIDGIIRVFDVTTGSCKITYEGHAMPVRSVAFSHNSRYIATASDDCYIRIFDMDREKCTDPIYTLGGHGSWVLGVTFAPDDKSFASCSADKTVKLWEFGVKDTFHTFKEHKDQVCSCKFNPEGNRLISVGDDHMICIYSV